MLKNEKEVGKKIFKELPDIKMPNKSWGRCDYCEVPLYKTDICWTKWHSQDAI